MSKTVTIDPVSRIEGHLRVDIEVDDTGVVSNAWSSGTMWRGIETILKGRDPREAWIFVQRICGVCTILINGASARSCLTFAVQADGADITTVEGLRNGQTGQLHPIQDAFIEAHGLQCGFCTPGFMMTTLELLKENPDPSEEEIKEALGGNLCRCTGYQQIMESVKLAAAKLRAQQAA